LPKFCSNVIHHFVYTLYAPCIFSFAVVSSAAKCVAIDAVIAFDRLVTMATSSVDFLC
jgi:hypothetical protein